MKNIFIVSLISLLGVTASADVIFTPSWFYMKYETEQGAVKGKSELSIYNLKLGTTLSSGLYLGAVYDMEEINDDERTSLGLGVGYIKNGWNLHLTYFVKSEFESASTKYEGTGINLELGHVFSVGSWGVGPTLSYRTFDYDEVNGASLSPKLKHNRILPYLTFQFMF